MEHADRIMKSYVVAVGVLWVTSLILTWQHGSM